MVYDEKKDDILKYNYSETQNYLFETGIQNIFNQYNKQIASLEAGKQKQVEDAYYIKELSKKYLGEYASNVGVGDVSGQLLDIYGKYQENIDVINQYYQQLQTGFESSYEQQKNQYEMGLLETQYNLEQQKIGEERTNLANQIVFNIQKGEIPEEYKSGTEYIEANREALGDSYAWELLFKNYEFEQQKEAVSKSDKANEVLYNLSTGLNLNGLSKEEYLEENKDILEDKYWAYKMEYAFNNINKTAQEAYNNIMKYETKEEWDAYIEDLYKNNKIGKEEAEDLKSNYTTVRKGSFTKVSSADAWGVDYFAPEGLNIAPGGDIYVGLDGTTILGETTTKIESGTEAFKEIDNYITVKESDVSKGKVEGEKIVGFDELFPYGGNYYVKKIDENGETVFVKYAIIPTPEQNIYSSTYKEGQEVYELLDEALNKKDGVIQTSGGIKSYKYEDGEYKQYLNFEASDVGKNKGTYAIDGSLYIIDKKTKVKDFGDEIRDKVKEAKTEKDLINAYMSNEIYKEFADAYFNGDGKKLTEYFKEKNYNTSSAMVILHNKKYYTINNGVLHELKRKEE